MKAGNGPLLFTNNGYGWSAVVVLRPDGQMACVSHTFATSDGCFKGHSTQPGDDFKTLVANLKPRWTATSRFRLPSHGMNVFSAPSPSKSVMSCSASLSSIVFNAWE
jgi:hypothetical protein